jgi:hypothetical protein
MFASELRRCARLPRESLNDFLVRQSLWQKQLDRHKLSQFDMTPGEHDTHAAFPQYSLDTVFSEQNFAKSNGHIHANDPGVAAIRENAELLFNRPTL